MTIRTWLRFVRFPNTWTAAADVVAGKAVDLAISESSLAEVKPAQLVATAFAAMLLYASGIVLNDLHDLEKDRREKPRRPLPSGAISPTSARIAFSVFVTGAFVLIGTTGSVLGLAIATFLTFSIFAYDVLLKSTPWARLAMGLCRAASLGLGLAGSPDPHTPMNTLEVLRFTSPFVAVTLLILTLTIISEREDDEKRLPAVTFLLVLAATYSSGAILAGNVWIVVVAFLFAGFVTRPLFESPARAGACVGRIVFSLPIHSALLCAGCGQWWLAGVALALFGMTRLSARLLATTES